ncbi:YciE/YciF ferroxidase family protein [Allosediminivita pacifica]|uniref:Ferritin-like metal-binding protein YciE n=1 Tax=Allosediminivita pacifica TaxID=1267769 RepID=A0A2T6B2I3_9RHOB|nr:ferritin-like domain-containing protein [Allosediminivita pacifica]PTX50290.1 ferritin-like metal-binding protein YciE [Allosediminivita pacifica]GGB02945.1 YciE/YciF family protein [Allosediminivita pacifica]
MKTLDALFTHFLRDIYYAEKQVLKTLPKMARKASSEDLKEAFEHHREETEEQIENLEKVFEMLGMKARGVTCEAIVGILDEGKEIMDETDSADARDAGMIAAAQAVEHYEMTRYGTLIAWSKTLKLDSKVTGLFEANLSQEKAADDKLTKLAEGALNREAA